MKRYGYSRRIVPSTHVDAPNPPPPAARAASTRRRAPTIEISGDGGDISTENGDCVCDR